MPIYYETELYHYGVPGMKWGHRKAQPIITSNRTARRKAKLAGDEAFKKSYAKSKKEFSGKLGGARKAGNIANKARKQAIKDSIAADKAHNKKIRTDIKENKDKFRDARADVSASRSTGSKVATFLLAGPFANKTYNSVIAAGGSKAGAIGVTAASTVLGGPLGNLVVSSIYKNQAAKGNTIKRYN